MMAAQNTEAMLGGEPQPRHGTKTLLNSMTVDVEDYFQVQALAEQIPRSSWNDIPRRVETNIDRLLKLFSDNRAVATFFTLGWIAERHPEMVRRIAAAGHELASHGYDHTRVDRLTPTSFREDVRRTKRTIEDIAGSPIYGYRAPTFSIGSDTPWAYEILEEEGYWYSSSIYPIRHDLYGAADAPRHAFRPGSGRLWEFPLATRRLLRQNFPCAGGGYFRLLPYPISRLNLYHVNAVDRLPCIFYLHPWEIDPGQPRIAGARMRSRLRHYMNLKAMPYRLSRLVADFRWGRIDEVFADCLAALPAQRPMEMV
jgi:polysaccharide deacetylase family protein (PEP-CTERM system associated)